MIGRGLMSGFAVVALVAAGIAVAPATGASEATARSPKRITSPVRVIGSFTPASGDPRLAALFARGGIDTSGFRFTPTDARRDGNRAVTIAVRSRSSRGMVAADRAGAVATTPSNVGLAPIAYNLGVAVGWRRFSLSSDVSKVDLTGMPGGRESVDVGISYTGKRFTGRVKAGTERPLASGPKLAEDLPAYSVDVGGSYALTRNLDVTAGVRYKAERNYRLQQEPEDERESQAVYIGTAFRF